ncbi:MAG: hypothetical protein H6923_01110 [Alphaproteobacteria bacterium]|nr:hypothetical protein [Alphaproteobacteria bacterium]
MITAHDLHTLARYLFDRHGAEADTLAARAIGELEAMGEGGRAAAWRALRAVVGDLIEGRLDPADTQITIQ